MQAADEFRNAIEQAGLTPPDTILADGKLHRFASNGERDDDAGWYVLHCDGIPAGCFGDWRSDFKQTWCSRSHGSMTEQERQEYGRRIESAQRQREVEELQRHAAAVKLAQSIWESARAADFAHLYLKRKGIQSHDLRVDTDNRLIVPIMIDDAITSLQFIAPDGNKQFLAGGKVKGGYFFLGEQQADQPVLLCEGFATAASLYQASGYPVVMAFSAHNLLSIAEQARQQFPSATIVLCGDNDLRTDGTTNTGMEAATAAAKAINGLLAIPDVVNDTKTDWNDVHIHHGLVAVKEAIEMVLNREQARRAETVRTDREPGLVKELSDEILRADHFAKDAGGELYVFANGAYRPSGDKRITQRVKTLLVQIGDSKHWSSHRAREVVEYIKVDATELWDRPKPDSLNLANGLLDLDTHLLRTHSADHLTSVQLPVKFDPSATCPLWDAFIEQVLPEDCRLLPFELVAASMCGEVSDQKAVLLVGSGENGKSTLLTAIVSFLGHENVSSLALQRLEIDRFAVVRLLGKLANVCADLPSDHLASTSTFKALTGGDRLTAERKFQGSFEFTSFARLLFSTNSYPQSKDSSQAFFRRWLVIPFDAVIAPHDRIPNLAARLAAPHELSGLLNRVLSVLPAMASRGGFSQSESTQSAMMEFRATTDPVSAWLDRQTLLASDQMVTKTDLTIRYNDASTKAGRPLMSAKAFYAEVKRLRPTITEAQRTVYGHMKDVFLGMGWRPTTPVAPADTGHPVPVDLFPEEVVDDDR